MIKNVPILILCGGRGKRLGLISKKIPKTLVKINNKPIINHKLDYYKKSGFNNFCLCIGYKGALIQKHLNKYRSKIQYSNSSQKAGILKRIYEASKKIEQDTMIISYGDTLAKINLKKLLAGHKNSKALITIVVSQILNPFGIVKYNSKNKLTKFSEKPTLNHFIGYAVFSKKMLNSVSKEIINRPDGDGIVKLLQSEFMKGKINIFKFNGLQLTINSFKDINEANIKYNKYFTLNENSKK